MNTIVLNGRLNLFSSLVINVLFSGYDYTVEAIFDTGAYENYIRGDVATKLKLDHSSVTGQSEAQHPLLGHVQTPSFDLTFSFDDNEQIQFHEKFNLMPESFNYGVIIGSKFLSKCEALSIDFIAEEYVLRIPNNG